ncbi:dimethylsulfonioproprionate lyase family protein [Candidatus Poriferisocius sp.]|uniref:dimethylsulfonioproprionate lyase family protein n=1 Tax=Candidatus Poriferisocius sp. TaxID=3101276 RepID=UPI003B02BB1B
MASQFTEAEFNEHIQRYGSKELDWGPFAAQGDLKEKYRRAHVRMVGASITGKHYEPGTVTADNFTLSVMMMPPGAEAPSHAHEVEEVFFVVKGELTAWWEDDDGRILDTVLKEREMIYSPAGIMHGLRNHTDEEALVQVVIGVGRPQKPTYLDAALTDL